MAVLETIAKKLGPKTDKQLADEVERLSQELRDLRRAHQVFVEDAHANCDRTIAGAVAELDRMLDRFGWAHMNAGKGAGAHGELVREIGALAGYLNPALAKHWHERIDLQAEAGAFSPLPRAEFEKRTGKLETDIRDRRVELERRQIDRRKQEADQELARLEQGAAT